MFSLLYTQSLNIPTAYIFYTGNREPLCREKILLKMLDFVQW